MIVCIGATPALQRVMVFKRVQIDEVNRAMITVDGLAGKSVNVAKVLRALGEEVLALGFYGGRSGEALIQGLQQLGIQLDFLPVTPLTRQCITVIDKDSKTHTELVEESSTLPTLAYDALFETAARHIPHSAAVVLSGTITPQGPAEFYARCVKLAREHGALPIVDARGDLLERALVERPALVKPNRSELAATVRRPLDSESAVLKAMRELCDRGAERVVVTSGGAPALAWDGRHAWRLTMPEIQPVNPIGSGDSFTAGLAQKLVQGAELGQACVWGAAAGAANALSLIPGDLDPQEVQRLAAKVRLELLPG